VVGGEEGKGNSGRRADMWLSWGEERRRQKNKKGKKNLVGKGGEKRTNKSRKKKLTFWECQKKKKSREKV